jgi:hypothetical protein
MLGGLDDRSPTSEVGVAGSFPCGYLSPKTTTDPTWCGNLAGASLDGSDGTRTRDLRRDRCDQTEVTRESLASLREDVADLRRRLDDAEHRAADLPHRERYLRLAIDFLRGFLDLHEQLVAEVERDFAAPRVASRPARAKAQDVSRPVASGRRGNSRTGR